MKRNFLFSYALKILILQRPSAVIVIDHLACHAAVDTNILPCYEARLIRAEIQHHVRNIERVSHPSGGLLIRIGAGIHGEVRIDPSG